MPTKLTDYEKRRDLCHQGQTMVYYLNDYGAIIHIKNRGWWCTNDCRRYLVGILPNAQLAQPTLGPFKTAEAACQARERTKR